MRLLALLPLTACLHTTRVHVEREPARGVRSVDVAPPRFVVDVTEGDPFRTNTLVGNLTFAGGFITESSGSGLYNVSKEVRADDAERYRDQAEGWLTEVLAPNVTLTDPPPPPVRVERRGSSRLDGGDNTSLPRVRFTPQAGGTFARPTVVPWVVTYVSHNGGWFYGQEFGTAAGARVRVLLVTHGADGAVLGWTDVDGSRLSERVFSPTGPQLQDLLIALEDRVGRKLDASLP